MKRWRLWAAGAVAGIAVVGTVVIASFWYASRPKTFAMGKALQAKDTEFTVGPCRGDRTAEGAVVHRTGLQSTAWDEAGNYDVRYAIEANCGTPFNYGGYKVAGTS